MHLTLKVAVRILREVRGRAARLGAACVALFVAAATLTGIGSPASAATGVAVDVPSAGGVYRLVASHSGKCVDVPGASDSSGELLQQWGCTDDSPWQEFRLVSVGSGRYRLVNVSSGLCLAVQGASTGSGAAVVQDSCSASAHKQWRFETTGDNGTRTWPGTPDGFASTGGGTTGGAGGTTVTVTTYQDLVRYATASGPYVIRVAAAITVSPYGREIPVTSDKTIVGVGTAGEIVAGGFFLGSGVHNVIIRNLTIRDTRMADDDPDDKEYDYDGIQMDTADHIWIDHNTIERMNDGLIDSRKDTTYLTVSWNILGENNKTFGIGWTDNVTARMTIHHNWIRDTNQRNPSIDNVALAHLYNNYLEDIDSYGNLSRGASRTVIENSYFENVNNPYYPDTSAASLTQSGSILVNCTGKQTTNGTTFRPSDYYSYTLDPASEVPGLLRTYAGPQANIGV
ncbi:RICIN domain-containing protein [Streptomyces sp. RFCAC02]|uniref:RICIN domain-containing protein n=1 Tax=Streptomyces sp. RFCAC02 TaxID=2499143 RepID=UPI00101F64CC|nr:RICIN domain-containing protein [Streptomyces sp. RFCAC02]